MSLKREYEMNNFSVLFPFMATESESDLFKACAYEEAQAALLLPWPLEINDHNVELTSIIVSYRLGGAYGEFDEKATRINAHLQRFLNFVCKYPKMDLIEHFCKVLYNCVMFNPPITPEILLPNILSPATFTLIQTIASELLPHLSSTSDNRRFTCFNLLIKSIFSASSILSEIISKDSKSSLFMSQPTKTTGVARPLEESLLSFILSPITGEIFRTGPPSSSSLFEATAAERYYSLASHANEAPQHTGGFKNTNSTVSSSLANFQQCKPPKSTLSNDDVFLNTNSTSGNIHLPTDLECAIANDPGSASSLDRVSYLSTVFDQHPHRLQNPISSFGKDTQLLPELSMQYYNLRISLIDFVTHTMPISPWIVQCLTAPEHQDDFIGLITSWLDLEPLLLHESLHLPAEMYIDLTVIHLKLIHSICLFLRTILSWSAVEWRHFLVRRRRNVSSFLFNKSTSNFTNGITHVDNIKMASNTAAGGAPPIMHVSASHQNSSDPTLSRQQQPQTPTTANTVHSSSSTLLLSVSASRRWLRGVQVITSAASPSLLERLLGVAWSLAVHLAKKYCKEIDQSQNYGYYVHDPRTLGGFSRKKIDLSTPTEKFISFSSNTGTQNSNFALPYNNHSYTANLRTQPSEGGPVSVSTVRTLCATLGAMHQILTLKGDDETASNSASGGAQYATDWTSSCHPQHAIIRELLGLIEEASALSSLHSNAEPISLKDAIDLKSLAILRSYAVRLRKFATGEYHLHLQYHQKADNDSKQIVIS